MRTKLKAGLPRFKRFEQAPFMFRVCWGGIWPSKINRT